MEPTSPPRGRLSLLAALVCSVLPTILQAQAADVRSASDAEPTAIKLRDAAMRGESVAWDFVNELTTRIGPRPAGSSAEQAAAVWAAKKLKQYGFDDVRVEEFPLVGWVRGTEHAEIVAPSPQPLVAVALGEAPATPAKGVEGEVVIFPTLDDLIAAQTGSLTGKVAMVSQHTVRTQDGAGYGVAVRARVLGPIEAAKRGAAAFILRSIGTDSDRLAHTGTTRYAGAKVPVPAFALSPPDADQIERLAALGEKVRVRLFSSAAYMPDTHSQNVIADIRGSERPDEVIVLGAHLDSWDLGTGAIDDAAGTAIITGAAKLIRDLPAKPRRTVRVVLYGSEETAQPNDAPRGGPHYTFTRKADLAKHVLAGESDFGADRIYSVALPSRAFESGFGQSLLRVLTPIGVLPASAPPEDGGTDVGPLAEAGVPVFLLMQDGTRYFDLHHTANDTLDKIDRAQLNQNVAAWASLVWLAAQTDIDFRALAAQK